jgi:hypothetical protein
MQELETRNKLYSVMRTCLQSLLLCLDGVEPTSTEMELMALDLYYSRVPDNWMKFSCLSRKTLASYMRYLNDSNHFFTSWLQGGVPTSIWLPAFSFPNLLFSATAINFAQHSEIGIESVALSFEILKREPFHVGMTAGVYLTGLSLNWARWDFSNAEIQPLALPGVKSLLAGSRGVTTTSSGASMESRTAPEGREPAAMWQVPVLHVKPARSNSLGKNAPRDVGPRAGGDDDIQHNDGVIASDSPGHAVYTCPMYRTSLRKNIDGTVALSNAANGFILNVPLPCFTPIHFTSEPQRFYSRLGTALLIETEP